MNTLEQKFEAWIKALRSGAFTQTKGRLKRTEPDGALCPAGHCCLGVLEEVLIGDAEGTDLDDPQLARYAAYPSTEFMQVHGFFTNADCKWTTPKGQFIRSLADMNDEGGHTFNEIADHIENHWKELWK